MLLLLLLLGTAPGGLAIDNGVGVTPPMGERDRRLHAVLFAPLQLLRSAPLQQLQLLQLLLPTRPPACCPAVPPCYTRATCESAALLLVLSAQAGGRGRPSTRTLPRTSWRT